MEDIEAEKFDGVQRFLTLPVFDTTGHSNEIVGNDVGFFASGKYDADRYGRDGECIGEKESQTIVNMGENRSSGVCVVVDDEERNRGEYDYLHFSNIIVHPQRHEYGDLGNLSPQMKDTELGLPVEVERNYGESDVL